MQSPAASRTGRLALLGRQVVQHAMQRAIPASAVATAGATFHLAEDHTTPMQRNKL